jgi:phosphate transport system permease protein
VPDWAYRTWLAVAAGIFGVLLAALLVSLIIKSKPALAHFGFSFITGKVWDPLHTNLGILPFIVGTLETTVIAMVIAVPIGVGTALVLSHIAPPKLRTSLGTAVELLAAVPSVVYGLWGLLIVAPWVRVHLDPIIAAIFFHSSIVSGAQLGIGLLLAGVILSIMVLPTLVALSRDVLAAVPNDVIEGAVALGATKWKVLAHVVLPTARVGVLGAATLAMGRALGETIAVTMVIGNANIIPHSLFSPAATMASVIANEFTEATEPFHLESLIGIGLVLLLVSILVNAFARLLVRTVTQRSAVGVEVL